jgi:hypothetical protein
MPSILTEQPLWRDDPAVSVELREAVLRIAEAEDSPALMAILFNELIQKTGNRTSYLKQQVEQVVGAGGSIDNLADIDATNKAIGSTLIVDGDGSTLIYSPLESGVTLLRADNPNFGELLSDEQRDFETGIAGWNVDANCTITQSSTKASTGTNAIRLEVTANGAASIVTDTGTNAFPCVAGQVASVSGDGIAQSTGRDVSVGFVWYDGSGTELSRSFGTAVASNSSTAETVTHEATAPASTAYVAAVARVEGAAGGEFHYFDNFSLKLKIVARSKLSFFGSLVDDPANGAIRAYAGGSRRIEIDANYRIKPNDDGVKLEVDTTAGAVTITLPSGYRDGFEVSIIKIAGANDVTVTANGTLNGASGTITGINTGLRVYVTGASTWRALPFSGGGIGSIIQANSAPTDGTWLACDGSVYLQAIYPALFEKIGLIYDDVNPDATSTGGAFSGGDLGVNTADKAFDNSAGSSWISSQSGASIVDTAWLSNDLTTAQLVSRVEFTNNNNADRMPTAFDVQGADDAAFTTNVVSHAVTGIVQTFSAAWGFDIPTPFTRRYIRAIAREQTPIGGNWGIAEMRVITLGTTYNSATEFVVPTIPISGQQVVSPFYIKAAN